MHTAPVPSATPAYSTAVSICVDKLLLLLPGEKLGDKPDDPYSTVELYFSAPTYTVQVEPELKNSLQNDLFCKINDKRRIKMY